MLRSSNNGRRTTVGQARRRTDHAQKRSGFTLIEVLMVVIIIGILVALLLPAIQAAIRAGKNGAVSAEINQLAQAMSAFKSKYGDYPPSRVYLNEGGYFAVGGNASNIPVSGSTDISLGALTQRSLIAMRKLFPRVVFSTTGNAPLVNGTTYWYDFNGNGVYDQAGYILQGHQCLVFFLGGAPLYDANTQTYGMSGFGKDPTNPFSNNIASDPRPPYNGAPNAMYSGNRQQPFYDFNGGRLFADPYDVGYANLGVGPSGVPGYYDSLNNTPPQGSPITLNFFVYFSSYGNGVYDPDDVNFPYEVDGNGNGPIGLSFLYSGATDSSYSPNPYTTTLTSATTTGTVTFENTQTFQIFSSGLDGLYGVGGQYVSSSQATSTASTPLPWDKSMGAAGTFTTFANTPATPTEGSVRQREGDNLTNFKSGTLQ
jgi:prepilin-type N-terminal cleavage/methylation domain-containing protein